MYIINYSSSCNFNFQCLCDIIRHPYEIVDRNKLRYGQQTAVTLECFLRIWMNGGYILDNRRSSYRAHIWKQTKWAGYQTLLHVLECNNLSVLGSRYHSCRIGRRVWRDVFSYTLSTVSPSEEASKLTHWAFTKPKIASLIVKYEDWWNWSCMQMLLGCFAMVTIF